MSIREILESRGIWTKKSTSAMQQQEEKQSSQRMRQEEPDDRQEQGREKRIRLEGPAPPSPIQAAIQEQSSKEYEGGPAISTSAAHHPAKLQIRELSDPDPSTSQLVQVASPDNATAVAQVTTTMQAELLPRGVHLDKPDWGAWGVSSPADPQMGDQSAAGSAACSPQGDVEHATQIVGGVNKRASLEDEVIVIPDSQPASPGSEALPALDAHDMESKYIDWSASESEEDLPCTSLEREDETSGSEGVAMSDSADDPKAGEMGDKYQPTNAGELLQNGANGLGWDIEIDFGLSSSARYSPPSSYVGLAQSEKESATVASKQCPVEQQADLPPCSDLQMSVSAALERSDAAPQATSVNDTASARPNVHLPLGQIDGYTPESLEVDWRSMDIGWPGHETVDPKTVEVGETRAEDDDAVVSVRPPIAHARQAESTD